MMFRKAKRSVTVCSLLASLGTANAAEITHRTIVDDIEGIVISGEISSADTQKFRQISTRYPKAVVILSSNGGSLLPAIEIGKIIKIAGYVTLVPDKAVCASSCALIWVAGTTRFLAANGRVGFHASYRDNNGKLEESGVANALIGSYLTLLNLSERAIIFATRASPDKILWLTKANQTSAGINFTDFSLSNEETEYKAAPVVQAPVVIFPAPPVKVPSSSKPVSEDGPQIAKGRATDSNGPVSQGLEIDGSFTTEPTGPWIEYAKQQRNPWVEYATDTTGSVYYYNSDSVQRQGSYVNTWERTDNSRDKTKKYRSSKSLLQYYCGNKSSRTLMTVTYAPNGAVVDYYTTSNSNFEPLVPDTIGMVLWAEICNQ